MLLIRVRKFGLPQADPTAHYMTVIGDDARTRWTKLAVPEENWLPVLDHISHFPLSSYCKMNTEVVGNPATNAQSPASQPTRELKTPVPLLPPEIILDILEACVEPFEHQAVFVTPCGYRERRTDQDNCPPSRIGVYKRRNWCDIPMFSFCHRSRQKAIKTYGLPQRDTFPFDKTVDTLTINLDEDATFLTGIPIVSSVLSLNVQQVTVISLDGITFSIDMAMLLASGHESMTSAALVSYIHHKVRREKALVAPGQTVTPLLQTASLYVATHCNLPQSNGITDMQEIIRMLNAPDRSLFSRTSYILNLPPPNFLGLNIPGPNIPGPNIPGPNIPG